jgi:hypothetical protein
MTKDQLLDTLLALRAMIDEALEACGIDPDGDDYEDEANDDIDEDDEEDVAA